MIQTNINLESIHTELILDESPVAYFITDTDGVIVYVNKKAEDIFGYTKQEMLSEKVELLIPEGNRKEHIISREQYAQNATPRKMGGNRELYGLSKDESLLPLEVALTPLTFNERQNILVTVIDISERMNAVKRENKYKEKIIQLQKTESLSVLAGGIAHDFNNILTGILGYADIAKLEIDEASPAANYLDHIIQSSRRAADLCTQMLAYSGKGHFIKKEANLNDLIREMVNILDVSISKDIVLRLQYTDQLPYIECDVTQIRQVIMNLITNAAESIHDKSGVVTISTGIMDCDQDYIDTVFFEDNIHPGVYCYIEINDTGCGMTHDVIDKIFDPFYTTKFPGRGLGLAAVHGIMRGHHGTIKIYSEPGKGSTVKCLFPMSSLTERNDRPQNSQNNKIKLKGKVLLVDDEESIRRIAGIMLKKLEIASICAIDGVEALERYTAHKDEIALIILDLTMPKMDGETCYRKLRTMDNNIPVIISSGYSENEISHKFNSKGVIHFIQKPYTTENLRQVILSIFPE